MGQGWQPLGCRRVESFRQRHRRFRRIDSLNDGYRRIFRLVGKNGQAKRSRDAIPQYHAPDPAFFSQGFWDVILMIPCCIRNNSARHNNSKSASTSTQSSGDGRNWSAHKRYATQSNSKSTDNSATPHVMDHGFAAVRVGIARHRHRFLLQSQFKSFDDDKVTINLCQVIVYRKNPLIFKPFAGG